MSNSDEDLFLSQKEDRPAAEVPPRSCKSQPQKSEVEYMWNVVFHWDIGNNNPFSLQPICNFTDAEVPPTWYSFKLRDDLRLKKIHVRMLNGTYSIFCKVEKGTLNLIFNDFGSFFFVVVCFCFNGAILTFFMFYFPFTLQELRRQIGRKSLLVLIQSIAF